MGKVGLQGEIGLREERDMCEIGEFAGRMEEQDAMT